MEKDIKKALNSVNKAIAIIDQLTAKDDLSNIPHYMLEETITEVYEELIYTRLTLNENL